MTLNENALERGSENESKIVKIAPFSQVQAKLLQKIMPKMSFSYFKISEFGARYVVKFAGSYMTFYTVYAGNIRICSNSVGITETSDMLSNLIHIC